MEGFKSFSQRTEFDFNGGVTAIVGPNGSGKSNVSDALRWVMGEASARELRGNKMEDVIFSGTQSDRAVNFAEVSLVLDNSTKVFPVDFPEVVVTRRVFKSGEGEYEINKRACRLRDISELFMDTGLGRGGYSVVGQGKIENILSTKSEERRGIFESAAGISKYKHRKEEAEKKLVQIEDNLDRVRDILSEIEGRIAPLEAQAKTAKQYLSYRDILKDAEVNLMLRVIDESREKQKQMEEMLTQINMQVTTSKETISDKENEMEKLYTAISKIDEQTAEQAQKLAELTNQKTVLSSGIEVEQNNCQNLWSNQKSWQEELFTQTSELNEVKTQKETVLTDILEWEDQIIKAQEKAETVGTEAETLKAQLTKLTEQIESGKGEVMELMQTIAEERAQDTGVEMLNKGFLERREYLTTEISQKKASYAHEKELYDERCKQIDTCKKRALDAEKAYHEAEAEVTDRQEKQTSCRDNMSLKEREWGQIEAKVKLLSDMREEGDGYPKAVKAILKGKKNGKLSGILDSVGTCINVKEEYITAIETAMGAALNHIITDDENSAKAAISYLKQNDLGRVTFLPLTSIKANRLPLLDTLKSEKGYVAVASDLVNTKKAYQDIIENLLGRTLVVDNMDNAVSISRRHGYRFKIVTLDGGVCNVGGSLTGGSSQYKSSVLSGSVYLEKLKATSMGLKNEIESLAATLASVQEELEIAVKRRGTYEKEWMVAKNESEEKDRILSAQAVQLRFLEDNLTAWEKEASSISQNLDETEGQKKQTAQNLEGLLLKKETLELKITKDIDEKSAIQAKVDVLLKEQTDHAISLSALKKDREMKNGEFLRLKTNEEMLTSRIIARKDEIAKADLTIKQAHLFIEEKQNQIKIVEKEIEKAQEGRLESHEQKEKMAGGIEAIKAELVSLRGSMEKLSEQKNALQEKVVRLSGSFDAAVDRLWEEYELSYSDASILRHDIKTDEAKKTVREMKMNIKNLGSVNVGAIDEYKETKERYDFLKKQVEDLTSSKEDLHKLIANMQKIMKEQFEESFALINENFTVVFRELFGGGSASLMLEDPNDPLSCNIVINVQPPGKKLQNLNLMSGGEKALSAISLLFSILRMKPTPFCILDEIDAPLDDVNVDGFSNYLKSYSKNTQFIMITHRQGTMEQADEIYGITMQRRGVSALLKLSINDVK